MVLGEEALRVASSSSEHPLIRKLIVKTENNWVCQWVGGGKQEQ